MHRFIYGPMHLVVHAPGGTGPLLSGIRAAVKDIDPTVPVFDVRTLDELRATSLEQERLILSLLGYFPGAVLAWLLYAFAVKVTNLPMQMTGGRGALILFLTIVMCGFSGMLAMRKLAQADPAAVF